MNNVTKSSNGFVRGALKTFAAYILRAELKANRSAAVANELRMSCLWAAGVRIINKYGRNANGDVTDSLEWRELHDALNEAREVTMVGHTSAPKRKH